MWWCVWTRYREGTGGTPFASNVVRPTGNQVRMSPAYAMAPEPAFMRQWVRERKPVRERKNRQKARASMPSHDANGRERKDPKDVRLFLYGPMTFP